VARREPSGQIQNTLHVRNIQRASGGYAGVVRIAPELGWPSEFEMMRRRFNVSFS
jgi:hypothetical protein